MYSFAYVTGFREIGRSSWPTRFARSSETYLEYFKYLLLNMSQPLIVFIDDLYYQTVIDMKRIYSYDEVPIHIHPLSSIDTFYERYLYKELDIVSSEQYQQNMALNDDTPEHMYPSYTLGTHSKVNYIQEAYRLYPQLEMIAWIDFGFVREARYLPLLDLKDIPIRDRIIVKQLEPFPENIPSAQDVRYDGIVYIPTGMYMIPTQLIDSFVQQYESCLQSWYQNHFIDDDQAVFLDLYRAHPSLFHLIPTTEWFQLIHFN